MLNWFDTMVEWKIGNGGKVSFLLDNWLGRENLVYIFPRLFFFISLQQTYTIDNMVE